ncbi:hypothetical protein BDR26DRAFT_925474 [Obelidium mucronatum]|nr:hypothetical protein BDR26DRAFT_925474 [Obelidium mucronatum]
MAPTTLLPSPELPTLEERLDTAGALPLNCPGTRAPCTTPTPTPLLASAENPLWNPSLNPFTKLGRPNRVVVVVVAVLAPLVKPPRISSVPQDPMVGCGGAGGGYYGLSSWMHVWNIVFLLVLAKLQIPHET